MPTNGASAKGSARREEILATAVRVASEKGFPGATVRGIGRELGIEPAHILYYFGSREQLLRELVEAWDAGSNAEATPDADALELYATAIRHNVAIRGLVHVYLSFATEAIDPEHSAHEFFRDRFALVVRELSATLREGQLQGVVRPDLDPERTARQLVALADGLQLQSLMDAEVDAPADLDAAIDDLFVARRRSAIARPARFAD